MVEKDTLTQNILVGTDFSEPAQRALRAAAILAAQNGASVTLAHVVDGQALNALPTHLFESGAQSVVTESEVETKIHQVLEDMLESHFAAVEDKHSAVIVNEDAALGLVEFARENGADLIVVGTQGRTGLEHILLGSVAEKVVRNAHCPVFTLRATAEG